MARDPYLPEFDRIAVPLPSEVTASSHDELYYWDAPEYLDFQRGKWWYSLMIGILTSFCIYALWSGAFVLLLTIILFSYIYYRAYKHGGIRYFPVRMTNDAIIHADERINYSGIEHYYILTTPEGTSLHIRVKKYRKEKVIYLPMDIDLNKIRQTFPSSIKEIDEPTEDLLHYLARLLKL